MANNGTHTGFIRTAVTVFGKQAGSALQTAGMCSLWSADKRLEIFVSLDGERIKRPQIVLY